jgi:phosphate transport system substrate-binding protein
VLVQGIAGDKYGLGFFGVAYYQENKDKLKLVGVDGGKGCIMPSIETISNGTYSPLARPVYIYVSSAAIKKPEVVEFVQYYLNEVSSLLKDVGYVPLTNEEYAAEHKKLEEFINKNK